MSKAPTFYAVDRSPLRINYVIIIDEGAILGWVSGIGLSCSSAKLECTFRSNCDGFQVDSRELVHELKDFRVFLCYGMQIFR